MYDQIVVWFLEMMPVWDGSLLSGIVDYIPYMAWLSSFIDFAFLGTMFTMIVGTEIILAALQLFFRAIEYIPGM